MRNDGGVDTAVHPAVSFPTAGLRTVTTTWTLGADGDPSFHPFHGWMKIHVTAPQDRLSEPANFTIDCGAGKQSPPSGHGRADLLPVLHSPMDRTVVIRNIGTGPAVPSRATLSCFKLGHTGGGGGCPEVSVGSPPPAPFFDTPDAIGINVPALAPGASFTVDLFFWDKLVWPKGTYRFTLKADVANVVAESNEANNVTTSTLVR